MRRIEEEEEEEDTNSQSALATRLKLDSISILANRIGHTFVRKSDLRAGQKVEKEKQKQ